jgi:hypothetical protein
MRLKNGTSASKPRAITFVLAACAAAACLAGCASTNASDPGSVANPGGPRVAVSSASASASATPTRPAKPAAERVPDSAMLTATLQTEPAESPSTYRTIWVTNAATIKEIAAYINALPTLPHYTGIVHCPMERVGPLLTLDFRDSAYGKVFAEVQVSSNPSGQCAGGVRVSVGGVTEPALDDSGHAKFYAQLEQLTKLP